MSLFVRRRRARAATFAAAVPLAFAACEDPPDFTEPDDVAFTAVAIDKATVRPREGERLTVGPTVYDLEVDVHWQNVPDGSFLAVYLETHDSVGGQNFRWEGDLVSFGETLETETGSTTVTTQFTLPEISPFCGSYDYARILAVVFPGGESPPNGAYTDEVFYPVSGSDFAGPCIADIFRAEFATGAFRVGEPFIVYGRDLPNVLDLEFQGAPLTPTVWPRFLTPPEALSFYPGPDDGYMIGFVPVGAASGPVRGFGPAGEVAYGPNAPMSFPVAASAEDVFEPNNDPSEARHEIYLNNVDPIGFWWAYGFNPSLTLVGADRTPDAVAPQYGQGDWFVLFDDANDICVEVSAHDPDDDIDLIVYDTTGAIVAESSTPSGSEGIRLAASGSPTNYFAWVTPWLATPLSTYAAYSYEVGWCANETGTDVLRFGPFFSPEQAQSQQASRLMPVMSGAANRAAPVRGAP